MKNDIETTLIEVDIDGEDYHLEMMDGSVWYVNPGDLPTIATWMPTSQIEIVQNEEGGLLAISCG